MNWMSRNVLITGAGGFIGSHLTERLIREGASVRAFVRYTSRHDIGLLSQLPVELLSSTEIISGDLRDSEAIRKAARGVDTIFHLGALIAIPYSYLHPMDVIETNVIGTTNVLKAAREFETVKVVHTSTSEVYGTAQYVPIDEKHPLQGQSPYSASKIGADEIAHSFYLSYGVPVAILRPFNTYGPRQSARAVIPTIISQALTLNQVRLGSLEPQRDFTYVEDTVDGFLRIGFSDKGIGQIINLGSEECISIGELAQKIFNFTGRDLPIISEEARVRPAQSEVLRLRANADKAHNIIGWRPRISLDVGLRLTIQWIQDHLDLYRPSVYEV